MIKLFKRLSRIERWLLIGILLIGLLLRLYPGADHFSWIYDQARDASVIRSIISEKNLILIGPQTDYPGLNHGPLSYYLLAPFYSISGGDPNLPGLFMILLNLSTLLPLGLLVQALFKNKKITLLSLFLFAISYEQVEYARWIFNFSVSIPMLVWSYYFLWKSRLENLEKFSKWNQPALLSGIFLGAAIQGEIFFLYLIPFFTLFLYWQSNWRKQWSKFFSGVILGVSPLLLAELKFKFIGTKTFFIEFLGRHSTDTISASKSLTTYIDHLAVTTKHTLGGLSYPMALLLLILLIGFVIYSINKKNRIALTSILTLFFSHSILFTFHFPQKVFVNVGLSIPLIILMAFALDKLWKLRQRLIGITTLILLIFFSIYQLVTNTANKTPFESYNFIQTGMLFSQKIEIVETAYNLAGKDEQFSFSVIGTPYGVRTVWATVFEQYVKRNQVPKPVWIGYKANGYPGENYFPTGDHPLKKHILIIESNQDLLPASIAKQAMESQDEATQLIKEEILYGYKIQLREKVLK